MLALWSSSQHYKQATTALQVPTDIFKNKFPAQVLGWVRKYDLCFVLSIVFATVQYLLTIFIDHHTIIIQNTNYILSYK